MIGLPVGEVDPQAGPIGVRGALRVSVIAFSAVAVQVYLVDAVRTPVIDHIDLPLAVVVGLVLARPAQSAAIAMIAGLLVDAFGHRLFGLHCLAYATLGPALAVLPSGTGRRGRVAGPAALLAFVATAVVVAIQVVADRAVPPIGEVGARLVLAPLWVSVLAPTVVGLGTRTEPWPR